MTKLFLQSDGARRAELKNLYTYSLERLQNFLEIKKSEKWVFWS